MNWVGIKYKAFGRDFSGADCWGLVCLYYEKELGIILPEYLGSDPANLKESSKKAAKEKLLWNNIEKGFEKKGDVVLLKIGNLACHVGIVVRKGTMLHIEKGVDSIHEEYNSPYWRRRIEGFFRYDKSLRAS